MDYIYDTKTSNESFIKICEKLKKNKVKEYLFPLKLYDKTLQGVNPLDESKLTLKQQARIKKEISRNIWYYLREIVRVKETGGMLRYKADLANTAITFLASMDVSYIEMIPRQNGKTIGTASIFSWLLNFGTINTDMALGHFMLKYSRKNIGRIKEITDLLPDYLKSHLDPKEDTDNTDLLRINANNNSVEALSSARDMASAETIGRGLTLGVLWEDELAFLKFNEIIMKAGAFALSQASEAAERNGKPHFRAITSTPNSLVSKEGLYFYTMTRNSVKFSFDMYNMSRKELKEYIRENSSNDYVFVKYHYYELDKDEKWVEEQKRLVDYDLATIKREIYLEWLMGSEDGVFEEEQLDDLSRYVKPYIGSFTVMDRYKFNIIEPLHNIKTRNYIASIDISAGGDIEQDYTVITIIDPLTNKPSAIFRNNKIDGPELVELLIILVQKYFEELVIVPERNNMGITIIQLLLKSPIANHIYFNVNESALEKEKEEIKIKKRNKEKTIKKSSTGKRIYGISTTGPSRDIMIKQILNQIVNERPEMCNNEEFYEELKTLIRTKKGKIEARSGCHDDVVMSYLIGLYMLYYGNNVKQFVKVTYIGNNEEENTNSEALKKKGRTIKKYNKMINTNSNSYYNQAYERFNKMKEINEKISLDDRPDDSQSFRKTKIKKNIKRLLH